MQQEKSCTERTPAGRKREVVLQDRERGGREGDGVERQGKGQHRLTDVIRNEGNMTNTTSLFRPLFLTLRLTHIAPSSTHTHTFPPPVGQCVRA